jgi:prophage DNA circulation protein
MIKKRKKEDDTAHAKSELKVLESLEATPDESDNIPSAIHHLQQGGLHIITPRIIPLLRAVVDKTASLVNEQSCKDHGKEMLKVAEAEFCNETTDTFFKLFMQHIPSTSTLPPSVK